MIYRLILGAVLGAIIGGGVGYAGKCAGGGCPLTCNPIGGIITGAIIGVLLASSVFTRPPAGPKNDKEQVIISEQKPAEQKDIPDEKGN